MKSIRLFAAGSALLLVLSTASPALAHDGRDTKRDNDHKVAINLGSILKGFRDEHTSDKSTKHATTSVTILGTVHAISGSTITLLGEKGAQYTVNAGSASITGEHNAVITLAQVKVGDKLHVKGSLSGTVINATSIKDKTVAENNSVSVSGTVTALTGATITMTGENGAQYSVNAASSTINGSSDASMLAKIRVGDKIVVKGSLSGSVITASKITNNALRDRLVLAEVNGVRGGTVTAIFGNTITVDRFGMGSTSVITNPSTFYLAGGSATSSEALKVGSQILVFGPTTTGTTDSISASVVFLLSHSVSFLKGLFR